ncbi:MAG: YlmH/Sll1252 family protein [Bacillota bacterium]|nr:YlmH/Sll1252 family protein [Bacillota bacterium]
MINKSSFQKKLSHFDEAVTAKVYDKIMLANKIFKPVFTNEFYPPGIWKAVYDLQSEFDVIVGYDGIFEDSERRMLAFSQELVEEYPIKLVKITNKSKFKELSHRDYLGAIMSLGIVRDKVGDLILEDGNCYCVISEDVCDYILSNLNFIGKCPCVADVISMEEDKLPKHNFETKEYIISSFRADCVVSSICGLSRSNAVELIKRGSVLKDYIEISQKDFPVEEDCTLTIKGYGKFKILNQIGYTNKERVKILVKKYI